MLSVKIKILLLIHTYKVQISSQTLQPLFLFLKLHSRQHVSALQSHHQAFLMNRYEINIYSAFGIPSVNIDGTVSIIVLWSDMGIYIHCRMHLKVKNMVYFNSTHKIPSINIPCF